MDVSNISGESIREVIHIVHQHLMTAYLPYYIEEPMKEKIMSQTIFSISASFSSGKEESHCSNVSPGQGATTAPLPLSNTGGAGKIKSFIHLITARTLYRLFPPDRTAWEIFLTGLLRSATIEPLQAWKHITSLPEDGDVAVVSFSSVEDLRGKLGLAYAIKRLYYTLFRVIGVTFELPKRAILFPYMRAILISRDLPSLF